MTALQNKMMKKLVYTLLLALVAPAAWAVDPGHYTDPNQLPEAFEWNFLRDDYYKPNINGEETKVRTQEITVIWDPTYINSKGSYGKLTIENFYNHERLKKVCNLTFDNDTHNANFQWNDDFTVCSVSITTFYFAEANSTSGAYRTTHKYAYVNNALYSLGESNYWIRPSYVNSTQQWPKTDWKHGGGILSLTIDIVNKSISITNGAWGVFMRENATTGGASSVLEYFVRSEFQYVSTDLVDIVNDPEIQVGDEVAVADDLLAVACVERNVEGGGTEHVLIAKDMGKFANPDVNDRNADDFLARTIGPVEDQSNWVVLSYSNNPNELLNGFYQGMVLKGGSIKGTLTNKTNPAISLSKLPTKGQSMEYTPNVYIVPSFCDDYASDDSPYFFVQPKPQEYCTVRWANYDANTNAFYVPSMGPVVVEGGSATSVSNPENLSGGFGWSNTYLLQGEPIDQQVFDFPAVVNKISYADTYNVWVHVMGHDNNPFEDGNTYIYAWKNDGGNVISYCGAWPGTLLTEKRTDSNGDDWYYFTFGNTCPDGIKFSRANNDGEHCGDITGLIPGDNFFNYYPYGYGDYYENKTSQYSRQSAPRRAQQHDPKVGALSERYVVMPLKLDVNSVVTAVADVHSEAAVASVRYVDAMGRVSATPHRGINIVVTRHTDGTTTTRKVVM